MVAVTCRRMRLRREPSGDAWATSMLQSPLIARTAVDEPFIRDCSSTSNLCSVRNRVIFPCVSCTAGRSATSLQLKVSGTSKISNQLNAGVSFTSYTQQANPQRQCKNKQVGDEVPPLAMDHAVVPLTEAHQANARDVDGND